MLIRADDLIESNELLARDCSKMSVYTLRASSALNPNLFSCLCQTCVHFPFPPCKGGSTSGAHRPFYKFNGHCSNVRRVIKEGDFYKVQHCALESPPTSERALCNSFLVPMSMRTVLARTEMSPEGTAGPWAVRWWHTGLCCVGPRHRARHCSAPVGG